MAGLLYNPLFNASSGLLAAGGPSRMPVSFGQALGRGLLQAQNADLQGRRVDILEDEQRSREELRQSKIQQEQAAQEAAAQQQAAMQRMGGLLSPQGQAMVAAGVPLEKVAQAEGLLGSAPNPTSAMQEYEFAKSQGLEGSFMDFLTSRAQAGRATTNVTTNVGGGLQTTIGKTLSDIAEVTARLGQMAPNDPMRADAERTLAALQEQHRSQSAQKADDTAAGLEGRIAVLDRELETASAAYQKAISEFLENPMDPIAKVTANNAQARLRLAEAARANFQGEPSEGVSKGFDVPGPTEAFFTDLFLGSNPAKGLVPSTSPDVVDLTGVK